MRIYYFGELVEENGRKVAKETKMKNTKIAKSGSETRVSTTREQTELEFENIEDKKTGMESIGDLLRDIDLSLDVHLPFAFGQSKASQL